MKNLEKLKKITKLSLSHNEIHVNLDKFSLILLIFLQEIKGIKQMTSLKELRLNDNKIMSIPQVFKEHVGLELLDLGNNQINDVK